MLCWLARIAEWVVLSTLGITGLLKLADLSEFANSLRQWTILPAAWVVVVAVLVPAVETLLLALRITRVIPGSRILLVAVGLLSLFVTAYLVQIVISERPNCNCFGLLQHHVRLMQSTWAHVAINGVLIGLSVFALICGRRSNETCGPRIHTA